MCWLSPRQRHEENHSAHPFELQMRKITFWTRRVKSFHTCTAPSPPPARPFSERNIYCHFRHHRHCQYLKSSLNVLLLAFWIFVSIGFRVKQVDSTSRYAVLAAADTTNSCYIAILSQQWHGMVDWNWPNKPWFQNSKWSNYKTIQKNGFIQSFLEFLNVSGSFML